VKCRPQTPSLLARSRNRLRVGRDAARRTARSTGCPVQATCHGSVADPGICLHDCAAPVAPPAAAHVSREIPLADYDDSQAPLRARHAHYPPRPHPRGRRGVRVQQHELQPAGLLVEATSGESYDRYIKNTSNPWQCAILYLTAMVQRTTGGRHRYWFGIPFAAPICQRSWFAASGQLILLLKIWPATCSRF